MLKNAYVLLISVLLLGFFALVAGEVPVNQPEDPGPLAGADIEEQLRELVERVREDPGQLLRVVLPLLPVVLIAVFWLFRALVCAAAKPTEVRGPREELSDRDSKSSESFHQPPAEEFQKSRQRRRLERTISNEQGTRGVPLG